MRVCVVMATYNGAEFLSDQLESICDQSIVPDEVVIVDDASSDHSVSIAKSILETNGVTYKVLENPTNRGVTYSFSRALSHATADIVFLADQDDVWKKEKIEECVKAFEERPGAWLLVHDFERCDAEMRVTAESHFSLVSSQGQSPSSVVHGMAMAVRKSLLSICLPIPSCNLTAHDTWLHWCARSIGRAETLNVVLSSYRRHPRAETVLAHARRPRTYRRLLQRSQFVGEMLELLQFQVTFLNGAFGCDSAVTEEARVHSFQLHESTHDRLSLFHGRSTAFSRPRFQRAATLLRMRRLHEKYTIRDMLLDLIAP